MIFDTIIIGAGFAGIVIAERLSRMNDKKILLVEQRNHIGGNCYDSYDEHGILIQKYGPHIFHTDNEQVWSYLSEFTDWHCYQHKVFGMIDGHEVPIPFNINTLYSLLTHNLASRIEEKLISHYGFGKRIAVKELHQSGDVDLDFLAGYVNDKVFLDYTTKLWGMKPEALSDEIFARVPITISRDNRYFNDKYQGLPKFGFTRMFEKMLNHPNIKILLNTSMQDIIGVNQETGKINLLGQHFDGKLIYTGMIDELFNYKFGKLPYRALDFKFEMLNKEKYQNAAVVNYPNNYNFIRITEFKHLTGQIHPNTSILREYPCQYKKNDPEKNVPCYPIFTSENQKLFEKYNQLIKQYENIISIGRLAEYQYYDMDDIVERALKVFERAFETL